MTNAGKTLDQIIAELPPMTPSNENLSEEAYYTALCEAYEARVGLLIYFIESCSGALAYCGRTKESEKVIEACLT